ncbi:hypothetical protein RIF29_03828 [Crotalaria pallida]|uniref:Uncharacterized protein n=1 Tax=Crotalaria pallida TaxID=3830 RepID=A0AAN9P8Y7_CROPI
MACPWWDDDYKRVGGSSRGEEDKGKKSYEEHKGKDRVVHHKEGIKVQSNKNQHQEEEEDGSESVYEKGYECGYKDGYDIGYERGHDDGYESGYEDGVRSGVLIKSDDFGSNDVQDSKGTTEYGGGHVSDYGKNSEYEYDDSEHGHDFCNDSVYGGYEDDDFGYDGGEWSD